MESTRSHFYKSMKETADQECAMLIKAEDNSKELLYLKCVALIIVSRMRAVLRGKSEMEIYKETKEFKSLSKLKANERHAVAGFIVKYI